VRTSPFVEAAEVWFKVRILGEYRGEYQLQIRHKPSGEAGQSNYTTSLSWRGLGELIRNLDLREKHFLLYGPAEGQKEPFYIEIK